MEYRLEELFELQMGKTPSRNNPEYWGTNDNKWISIADLSRCGKYIYDTKECLSDKAVAESGISQIPANTVVMSFKLSIGKTAITPEPMYSNEAIMSFRDKHVVELLPEYVYYLLLAHDWDEGTNKAVMGKTLNKATLSKVRVNIHPIEKQAEIVEVLNKGSAIIEARQQELLKLDELIKARFVEMFGDPEINNKNFCILDLAEVCTKITDGSHNPPKGISNSNFLMLSSKNIVNDSITFEEPRYLTEEEFAIENKRTNVDCGDVLLTIVGTVGRSAVVPNLEQKIALQRSVAVLKPKHSIMNSLFLKYYLDVIRHRIENESHGIAQMGIYLKQVKELGILVPPMEKQEQFADFVKQVDKSKFEVQKSLDKAQLLFDSLMQEYFE